MKAERTEGGRFEAHLLAARRDACRYKDGFRNPSVVSQGAFERNITAGDEALSNGKGMDGIAAIRSEERRVGNESVRVDLGGRRIIKKKKKNNHNKRDQT